MSREGVGRKERDLADSRKGSRGNADSLQFWERG